MESRIAADSSHGDNPVVAEIVSRHPQLSVDQPAQRLLGIEDVYHDDGSVTARLRPGPSSFEPDGRLVAGVLCVLADNMLGLAAVRAAAESQRLITTNIHLDLADLSRPADCVTGTGRSSR
jgi:acyl-coenzyme A thioesterase PaaI-like protein